MALKMFIKSVIRRGDDLYINDKYLIDKNGVIYYAEQYAGDTSKDFPLWIFELRDALFN